MILLKEQEEPPEILPSKTIYCSFPANNCQNSACGQNTRECWVLFVLGQSHFPVYLNDKIFLLVLCKVESEALKAVLVGLESAAAAASAGEWSGLLPSSEPASELSIAVLPKARSRGWDCGLPPLIVSLARWALQLRRRRLLMAVWISCCFYPRGEAVCSTGVKDERQMTQTPFCSFLRGYIQPPRAPTRLLRALPPVQEGHSLLAEACSRRSGLPKSPPSAAADTRGGGWQVICCWCFPIAILAFMLLNRNSTSYVFAVRKGVCVACACCQRSASTAVSWLPGLGDCVLQQQ